MLLTSLNVNSFNTVQRKLLMNRFEPGSSEANLRNALGTYELILRVKLYHGKFQGSTTL